MSKKLLLVEDEAIIAMSTAKMLKKHNFEVVTAHKGEKAVEIVKSNTDISLILMDIDLGDGIDGTETAQKILAEHDIPIVFFSSHTEPEVVEKTEGITSYGYIVKNSGETVLLASIKMAFRLYEAHLELKQQKVNLNTALTKYENKSESLQESEALYRNLMENSIDGVELLDEKGRFLNVNQSECEMLGYSREEMLTMRIADIDPNYLEDDFYNFWKEKPKGASFLFETLHRHKNGTLIPVEVNGIFFEVNGKKYIYGVARNISKRRQAENDIKAREEYLRTTLNSIGDAVISTDLNGNIIRMNPIAERLCGWSLDVAKGKQLDEVFQIINADTREIVDNPVEKVFENGENVGLGNHTVLISREGHEYQIADSAAPIKNDEGNINGVVLVFRDVTEEYEKERQLRERVKELDCLYKIAGIVEEPNASLSYILQQTAELIPQFWQYPETCECGITLDGNNFQSTNFSETKWKLSSNIAVHNDVCGEVVVCYLEERPTADEGPFFKEERRLLDEIAERLEQIVERTQAEERLRSIEWMLSNKSTHKEIDVPEYGDVSELNKDGLILSSVGKEQLRGIASEYLDLLETSTAIYEKNGDYALGIFSSGWCQLMDSASRQLCRTKDNRKALESGKWLCHESCWKDASLSMKEGRPVEIKCNGGIKMYAVPVRANGEIVGAINFGYENPPKNEAELKKLADRYKIPINELKRQAEAYKPRPQFIIDYAKERIQTAAKTLGHLIERKQTERALNQEQFFLASVLNNIKDAIIICNEKGEIIRFNESARRLHGLPEKPIYPDRWAAYYDLYYPDGKTPLAAKDIPLFRALQGEDVNNLEIIVKPKKDTPRILSCNGQQIRDKNGKKTGAVIAMHDITELKNSREKYKRLVNNSPNLIMETDIDTHEIISCNPAIAKNLGYPMTEIVGKKLDAFLPQDILKKRIEVGQKAVETGGPQTLEDVQDGNYLHIIFIPIISDERRSVQTIAMDITERKNIENQLTEKEERYKAIFYNSEISLWEENFTKARENINELKQRGVTDFNKYFDSHPEKVWDLARGIEVIDINEATLRLYEADSKAELVGSLDKTLYLTDDTYNILKEEFVAIAEERTSVRGEMKTKTLNGTVLNIMMNVYLSNENDIMIVAISDITQYKKALQEKDYLMRELNHRVKNNLTLVSSLISLKDSEIAADLTDLKYRLDAVRLVHEKLHQYNDVEHLEANEYFQELLEAVFSSSTHHKVRIENNIEEVNISTKMAIPLGLVVNEIATNAIKYGFTSDEESWFSIKMYRDEENTQYVLTLSNSGNPFPEEIGLENPSTMGLRLVIALIDQLNGTMELQKKPNPVFTIRFSLGER